MKKSFLITFICIMLIFAVSCTYGNYSISMGDVDFKDNKVTGSYENFNGYQTKTVKLEKGRMQFDTTIETMGGSLTVQLLDKDNNSLLSITETGAKQISIPEEGSYKIKVQGEKHKGSFEVQWNISQ